MVLPLIKHLLKRLVIFTAAISPAFIIRSITIPFSPGVFPLFISSAVMIYVHFRLPRLPLSLVVNWICTSVPLLWWFHSCYSSLLRLFFSSQTFDFPYSKSPFSYSNAEPESNFFYVEFAYILLLLFIYSLLVLPRAYRSFACRFYRLIQVRLSFLWSHWVSAFGVKVKFHRPDHWMVPANLKLLS